MEINSNINGVQATKICDYDIPKGTMIIPLQWAIHTDPSYWHDPLSFKPDRFIDEDGSLMKPEAFLPFQVGKKKIKNFLFQSLMADMLLLLFVISCNTRR